MIGAYKSNNKNFNSNPDMTLMPISCKLKRELNTGINEVELVHDIDKLGRWKYLECGNVLCVPTPTSEKQLYVIYDKVTNSSDNTITVKADSEFFRLINKQIFNCKLSNVNGQEALNSILTGTSFTGHSNITTRKDVDFSYMNALQAINANKDNNFINVFKGELDTDNFNVYINTKIGTDNGARAEFGFNLESIEENINDENVWTRLIPISGDGILLEGSSPWIDSPLISNYSEIKSNYVVLEDAKLKKRNEDGTINEDDEGYNTVEELRQAMINKCRELFANGIDTPSTNYKVSIVNLENTTAYSKYKNLLKINLGDVVHTKHKSFNIDDIRVRCISYEYDCLIRKYEEVELGKYVANYVDIQNEINENLRDQIQKTNETIVFEVTSLDKTLRSKIQMTEDKIHMEVVNTKKDLQSQLDIQADKISAVVTEDGTGMGWELSKDAFKVACVGASDSNVTIDKDGLAVNNGKFTLNNEAGDIAMQANTSGSMSVRSGFKIENFDDATFVELEKDGITFYRDGHSLRGININEDSDLEFMGECIFQNNLDAYSISIQGTSLRKYIKDIIANG